jgi:uncharacterized protein (DUF488 family)
MKIYTIGYEGTEIHKFIRTLVDAGIGQIADIRARPFSRKQGFSKTLLEHHLARQGIGYRHFGGLGDPKAGRDAMRAGDYISFLRIYLDHFAGASAEIDFAQLLIEARKQATCLLCFERNPDQCHRTIVAKKMALEDFEIVNLFDGDSFGYRTSEKREGSHFGKSLTASEQNLR